MQIDLVGRRILYKDVKVGDRITGLDEGSGGTMETTGPGDISRKPTQNRCRENHCDNVWLLFNREVGTHKAS